MKWHVRTKLKYDNNPMSSSNSKAATHLPAYLYPEEEHKSPQQQRSKKSQKIIIGIYCKVGYQTQHVIHNIIHNIS